MWKCLVESNDLIAYEKQKGTLKVRIEARLSDNMWEIYKTYQSLSGNGVSFTEEYEANDRSKALQIISKIKKEVLDEVRIKTITELKKNVSLKVKRVYKEDTVEKWSFALEKDDYSNYVIIRYSDEIEMDIIVDDKYKYLESEILDEVNKIMGFNELENDLIQNIFFYSKKSGFYTCDDLKEKNPANKVEIGFALSNEDED